MIKDISIVYPIYNESKRLKYILSDIKRFNKITKKIKKEYIFVNDGSLDNSNEVLKNFIEKEPNKSLYKIYNYKKNKGKGFALKLGVSKSSKKWILTADSDCSVSNFQIIKWLKKKHINDKNKIYFGSRNHPNSHVKKKK